MSDSVHDGDAFDLEVVRKGFYECKLGIDDGSIPIQPYLYAYRELCKFFHLLGKAFGFVATDIEEKIATLELHMKSDAAPHYSHVNSMISFETENNRINSSFRSLKSGCRSLLRLHRALEFILMFMGRVAECDAEAKMSSVAQDVYSLTLSHHHPWLVRKVAALAMYTLPTRDQLVEALCKHDVAHVQELIAHVLDAAQPVYDNIQTQLSEQNLLNIS